MSARDPRTELATHDVINQPPVLENYNLFESDLVLRAACTREGAHWADQKLVKFGGLLGRDHVIELGFLANRHKPELEVFDRSGRRIDEVNFHPAYHDLMKIGIENGVSSIAWTSEKPGGHVTHAAMEYMLMQVESGVCCPITMTYAAAPLLAKEPALAHDWRPKILAARYDPRSLPISEKSGVTIGMAMTEKQGGSDVRTNTTKARALGSGGEYALTGHKYFCSAPMCDGFLTLAVAAGGLTCFFVPRWRPDGARNNFLIQRLKDKLGNWANASSEIEYADTWACKVGEEGRGVQTIIEMVHHTRLDTAVAPGGLMRQALIQAIHHAVHRTAFQRKLIDQPLMQNVLADLAVESEAATCLAFRMARAYDHAATDESAAAFARLGVAIAKYWINKRTPNFVYEAMECLGGGGYVETGVMPRLFRESPLNSIWEGSGNVICLDVLRAIVKDPGALDAVMAEIELAKGGDRRLDAAISGLKAELADPHNLEGRARLLTERLALALQGSLLVRHSIPDVADAFCATRLQADRGHCYGTLPAGADFRAIISRSWAAAG